MPTQSAFMAMCLTSLSVAGFNCVKCYVDVPLYAHCSCIPIFHGPVLGALASLSVAGFYCIKCYVDVTSPGRVIDATLETVDTDTDDIGTHGHSSATQMHPGTLVRKRGVGFKTQTCEIKYR